MRLNSAVKNAANAVNSPADHQPSRVTGSRWRIVPPRYRGVYADGFPSCLGSAPEPSSTSQQPGSPGWPQQLLRVRTLVQLLTTIRSSFWPRGMRAPMFENTDLRLGIASSSASITLGNTRS